MKSQSINISNVYIESIGIIVSKKEKEGPLGKYFQNYINDYYYDCKSFEKAQIRLAKTAIANCVAKSKYKLSDIKLAIGGDLSNQIFSTTSTIKEEYFPFIGIYAACASGTLALTLASIYMNVTSIENSLVFISSHICVSERQLRYPNEYASIAKDTTTNTVTGACAIILSNKESKVKITKATIGKIVDIMSNNINDMGTCMAYAAIDTLLTHFSNNNESIDDYDLIVTGDLSSIGSKVFIEELANKQIYLNNKYFDCGANIYDNEKQKTSSGGSGPACVMCVTFSYIYKKILKGKYRKVLLIATGALHSQISYQQNENIPCIAHAIVLEGN